MLLITQLKLYFKLLIISVIGTIIVKTCLEKSSGLFDMVVLNFFCCANILCGDAV